MSHAVHTSSGNRYEVVLEDAPENCVSLVMKPDVREDYLNRGVWLVLLFGVWSTPDRAAIDLAVSLACDLQGCASVGIRPFDDPSEAAAWLPELPTTYGSPIWIVLKDGRLKDDLIGLHDKQELLEAVKSRC